jgi:hypothetical protein
MECINDIKYYLITKDSFIPCKLDTSELNSLIRSKELGDRAKLIDRIFD